MKIVSRQFMWIGLLCYNMSIAYGTVRPADDHTKISSQGNVHEVHVHIANPMEKVITVANNQLQLLISHNKYKRFDVLAGTKLVLNNDVGSNPNLKRAATLIINEVVEVNSGEKSILAGEISIKGTPAEVVITNPWGILCDGCVINNIPKLTLATAGVDVDAAGVPSRYKIAQGLVEIVGAGLKVKEGQQLQELKILSRAFALNAESPINAAIVNILLGPRILNFDGSMSKYSTITPPGKDKSGKYAMFIAATNGITAGRILIVASEKNRGIYNEGYLLAKKIEINYEDFMESTENGKITASEEGLFITSRLTERMEGSSQNAFLPSENDNKGQTHSGNNQRKNESVFINNGNIKANSVYFTMDHLQLNAASTIKAGQVMWNVNKLTLAEDALLDVNKQVAIYTHNLDIKGNITAANIHIETVELMDKEQKTNNLHVHFPFPPMRIKEGGPITRPEPLI